MTFMIFKCDDNDKTKSLARAQEVSLSCGIQLSSVLHWHVLSHSTYGKPYKQMTDVEVISIVFKQIFKELTIIVDTQKNKVPNKFIKSLSSNLIAWSDERPKRSAFSKIAKLILKESAWYDCKMRIVLTDDMIFDLKDAGVTEHETNKLYRKYKKAIKPVVSWLDDEHKERNNIYNEYRKQLLSLFNMID